MEVLGNVLGGVKELYDKTNKANLSGAIDVVVVKQVIARTRFHETFFVTLLTLLLSLSSTRFCHGSVLLIRCSIVERLLCCNCAHNFSALVCFLIIQFEHDIRSPFAFARQSSAAHHHGGCTVCCVDTMSQRHCGARGAWLLLSAVFRVVVRRLLNATQTVLFSHRRTQCLLRVGFR